MDEISLREKKKQETHAAIVSSALTLFIERGYAETTLQDIAEQANVSQRTIFSYFPSKEAILFDGHAESIQRFMRRLDNRGDMTIFETLRSIQREKREKARDPKKMKLFSEVRQCIDSDEHLQEHLQGIHLPLEQHLIELIAEEQGISPDSLEARLVAASFRTAFQHLNTEDGKLARPEAMEVALRYVEGGLQHIKDQSETKESNV